MVLKMEKIFDGGSKYYPYDEEKKLLYRSVFAGFVPPGSKGGAIAVCGQEHCTRPPSPIHVLAEAQHDTASELIDMALDLISQYKISEFFGFLDDDFSRYLSNRNMTARERRMAEFHISPAPNSNSPGIGFHINLTRDLLSPNRKLLILGESKALRAALQELSKPDMDSATAKDYPLLAALCAAVAAFEVNPPGYGVSYEPEFSNYKYDVLNYSQGFNID